MSTLHDQRTDNFYDKADEKWNPANTIQSIILSMMLILQEPNLESPANIDAAKELRENKISYLRKVRQFLK
jgi:ubiquitin-conjugating enzyme E2 G1